MVNISEFDAKGNEGASGTTDNGRIHGNTGGRNSSQVSGTDSSCKHQIRSSPPQIRNFMGALWQTHRPPRLRLRAASNPEEAQARNRQVIRITMNLLGLKQIQPRIHYTNSTTTSLQARRSKTGSMASYHKRSNSVSSETVKLETIFANPMVCGWGI